MKQPTHPSGGWVPAKAHASFTQGVDYEAMISNGFQPHLSVLFLFHRATTQHLSQTLQVWHIYLPTLTIIDPNVSNYGIHGVFGYSIYPCQYTLGLQPYPQVPWYSAPLAPTPVPPSKRRWDRSPIGRCQPFPYPGAPFPCFPIGRSAAQWAFLLRPGSAKMKVVTWRSFGAPSRCSKGTGVSEVRWH